MFTRVSGVFSTLNQSLYRPIPKELGLACTWEDDTHGEGGVGFRAGGGEHCLYDNVLVTTIESTTAVNPDNALPITWGKLKEMR
jgi:hypothetical protein